MITNEQEKQEIIQKPQENYSFAIVTSVSTYGLTLRFGNGNSTQKRYKYNKSCTFKVYDKVVVQKIGGEYVVFFPI